VTCRNAFLGEGRTNGEQGGGSLLKAKLGNPAPGVDIL